MPTIKKGLILGYLKRHRDAIAAYNQSIHLKSNFTAAYIGLGKAYSALKEYSSAIDNFDRALQLDPYLARIKIEREEIYLLLEEKTRDNLS